jgi:hypothetical protein
MAFDWADYLKLAEELAARTDEASKRSAISRAYYFVFNTAFARAESTAGRCPVVGGEQSWCWTVYRQSPDHTCKRLGVTGDILKRRRVDADYKGSTKLNLEDVVRTALLEARRFQADFAVLPARFPRP